MEIHGRPMGQFILWPPLTLLADICPLQILYLERYFLVTLEPKVLKVLLLEVNRQCLCPRIDVNIVLNIALIQSASQFVYTSLTLLCFEQKHEKRCKNNPENRTIKSLTLELAINNTSKILMYIPSAV